MTTSKTLVNPAELAKLLDERQHELKIIKTTVTPSGRTIDWVPVESQHPQGHVETPPSAEDLPAIEHEADKPLKAVQFELDEPGVERGPEGTVPLLRPDAKAFALTKLGGVQVNKNRRDRKPTDPNPFGYFHAISTQNTQNPKIYGCEGYLNVWDPKIDIPSSPGDDHSIVQTWLQNYDKPKLQSIEAGLTVDKALNGDASPHLFTYFTTNGYTADGNNLGGYNRLHSGWVQYSSSIFPGIRINGTSTPGGTQYWFFIKYQLYRGNWWFGVQGAGNFQWIGYYPGSLFNGGIANDVEWVGFGGEVYSALSNPSQTQDQMGSGRQAQEGWGKAAFLRNLRNQSNANGAMVNHNGTAEADTANGGANPYDVRLHMNSGTSWGSYLYVGGPTP